MAPVSEEAADLGLVGDDEFAVVGDHHGLHAERGDLGDVVVHDVGAHRGDPVWVEKDRLDLGGASGEELALFFGQGLFVGHLPERLVEAFLVEVRVDQPGLDVDGNGGAVCDGPLDGVARHDPAVGLVLGVTEERVGVPVGVDDRGTGEAEEAGVREGGAHVSGQRPFLGPVRFVDEDDDVVALVQRHRRRVLVLPLEPEDRRQDDAALVPTQCVAQFGLRFCDRDAREPGGEELALHLLDQVQAVQHYQDGGRTNPIVVEQAQRSEAHEQGLAGPLGVLDESTRSTG